MSMNLLWIGVRRFSITSTARVPKLTGHSFGFRPGSERKLLFNALVPVFNDRQEANTERRS